MAKEQREGEKGEEREEGEKRQEQEKGRAEAGGEAGEAGGEAGELLPPPAHARIGDATHHAKPCPFGAVAISKQESAISPQESAGPRRLAPQAAEGQSRAAPWALSLKAPLLAISSVLVLLLVALAAMHATVRHRRAAPLAVVATHLLVLEGAAGPEAQPEPQPWPQS